MPHELKIIFNSPYRELSQLFRDMYISVKGSRVRKPCNVLAVRKYVRASMV